MALPFTVEQFYGVFRDYNTAVWPVQWTAFLLGVEPDLRLIAAGVVGLALLLPPGRPLRTTTS